jgi:hypothetical protein
MVSEGQEAGKLGGGEDRRRKSDILILICLRLIFGFLANIKGFE